MSGYLVWTVILLGQKAHSCLGLHPSRKFALRGGVFGALIQLAIIHHAFWYEQAEFVIFLAFEDGRFVAKAIAPIKLINFHRVVAAEQHQLFELSVGHIDFRSTLKHMLHTVAGMPQVRCFSGTDVGAKPCQGFGLFLSHQIGEMIVLILAMDGYRDDVARVISFGCEPTPIARLVHCFIETFLVDVAHLIVLSFLLRRGSGRFCIVFIMHERVVNIFRCILLKYHHDHSRHVILGHIFLRVNELASVVLPQRNVVLAAVDGVNFHIPSVADDPVDDVAVVNGGQMILGAKAVTELFQALAGVVWGTDAVASGLRVGVSGGFEHSAPHFLLLGGGSPTVAAAR